MLGKVSSGQRINSAQDDASGYSISEKMREQIRTLLQDNQNVQNGSALFKIADGGINSIVDELRNLKELAINAANDTNTDEDRKIMQKEFFQRYTNINDIATETNYNGKALLDGTYHRKIISTVFRSSGSVMIYDDGYNIDSDGVYILAKDFTGTVNVNAQNVKITQEDPTTALNDVSIIGVSGGQAKLWIENLNIKNTFSASAIKFTGNENYLIVKGTNFLDNTGRLARAYAAINSGNGLTIIGDGYLTAKSVVGAGIGSNVMDTVGDINIGGNVHVYATGTNAGAGIGSGYYFANAGNINIGDNAYVYATSDYAAGIGSGVLNSTVGNITISNLATINVTSTYGTNDIGAGMTGSTAGNVIFVDTLDIPINTDLIEPVSSDSESTLYFKVENPLKIHHGAKANQATNFYIEDMHTKSLGTGNLVDDYGIPLNDITPTIKDTKN